MIVYELITNLKPFDNFSIFQIQIQGQKGYRPEIGIEIPDSYRALIQDCWAQDPSKRPSFEMKINKMNSKSNINIVIGDLTFFSYNQYKDLDENCRKLVDDAKDDPEKLYNIGISLIEGKKTFPINTEVGIKYLEKSIEKGFTKAVIYYCKMLIKGKIIFKNYKKATKIAENKLNDDEGYQSLIMGKIEKKKQNLVKALHFFKKINSTSF